MDAEDVDDILRSLLDAREYSVNINRSVEDLVAVLNYLKREWGVEWKEGEDQISSEIHYIRAMIRQRDIPMSYDEMPDVPHIPTAIKNLVAWIESLIEERKQKKED